MLYINILEDSWLYICLLLESSLSFSWGETRDPISGVKCPRTGDTGLSVDHHVVTARGNLTKKISAGNIWNICSKGGRKEGREVCCTVMFIMACINLLWGDKCKWGMENVEVRVRTPSSDSRQCWAITSLRDTQFYNCLLGANSNKYHEHFVWLWALPASLSHQPPVCLEAEIKYWY